jgi:hypothetical protein
VDDDADDPATAVNDAKTLIGQGVQIIGGSVDSAIAPQVAAVAAQNKVLDIAGPAAADQLDNLNRYTFRSGRESYQDVATAGTFVGSLAGRKVVVLPTDVDTMIGALEGWSFAGVEGQYTIRASDHALLQPEFEAKLTGSGTAWTPQLVRTVPANEIAPPASAKPAWNADAEPGS